MSVKTRTFLRGSARQVTMPHNLRLREKLVKSCQHIIDASRLLRGKCIARFAVLVKTALIADADGTTVVRSRMSTHLQEETMLRHRTILSDIKVIADVIEAPLLVVTSHLFSTIVLVAACSRAMQYQIFHGVGTHHQLAVLHSGEECPLIAHQLLTDG